MAVAYLDVVQDFINGYDPDLTADFAHTIRAFCSRLCKSANVGSARADLGANIRALAVQRYLVVIYKVTPEAVVIIRVLYRGHAGAMPILRRMQSLPKLTPTP